MTDAPRLTVDEVATFERPATFRMPFRFGVVTLTEAPQLFVRARVRLEDGREGRGMAADLLVPKWFDKSPDLTNEDNFEQLRRAVRIAADLYRAERTPHTAFGLHAAMAGAHEAACAEAGLPGLVASFGTAALDRAVLDALLRIEGASLFAGARANLFGLTDALTPDLAGVDLPAFLRGLSPARHIALRHTVGLADPLTAAELDAATRLDDGLPETLEGVIAAYGVDHFKLKVSGDLDADLDRLRRIAGVLEPLPAYRATLDGNEQFADAAGALALWQAILADPALARLREAILFLEQPVARSAALSEDVAALAAHVPVEIDESDDAIDAFPRALALGYTGVSSKSCKGLYKALLNRARCATLNADSGRGAVTEPGAGRHFMSAEDLTTQAGLAVQQDLALATLIGCTHVERNGHHYVRGMAAAPEAEQAAFLAAHPDLYYRPGDTALLRVQGGRLSLASLDVAGLGSAVLPDPPTAA
ncbi:MAG: mandelate racemase [Paracoccaceae bacterium]|jgi:hypothetical protein|nr:mandelate racemase [Paracoccaceae bacterium]